MPNTATRMVVGILVTNNDTNPLLCDVEKIMVAEEIIKLPGKKTTTLNSERCPKE